MIFDQIDISALKMQHASEYIDFYICDILDYSVLNDSSENSFLKENKTFDIRNAISTVLDMVTDLSKMNTIGIKTELMYPDNGNQSHLVNTD